MRAIFVTLATLVLASTVVSLAAPVAMGHHCDTRIGVYGRASPSSQPPPPYALATQGICAEQGQDTAAGAHTFPPNADQVFVRINGDFGDTVPSVRVELTGFGFDHASITLDRKINDLGGFTYQAREWHVLPAPFTGGELEVVAFYPSGQLKTSYRAADVNFPLPAPPAVNFPPSPPSVG